MSLFDQVTLPTCMLMFLSQMINTFTEQYITMVVQVNLTHRPPRSLNFVSGLQQIVHTQLV